MAKETKEVKAADASEDEENYLKYVMKGNTININMVAGATVIFQSGSATPPPPKG